MSSIRNIAQESAFCRAVNLIPGCACVSVTPQADYYIVHLSEFGGSRVIRVSNAAHAMRTLNRQEPET